MFYQKFRMLVINVVFNFRQDNNFNKRQEQLMVPNLIICMRTSCLWIKIPLVITYFVSSLMRLINVNTAVKPQLWHTQGNFTTELTLFTALREKVKYAIYRWNVTPLNIIIQLLRCLLNAIYHTRREPRWHHSA